jgi:hypothetical protein
LTEQQQAVYVPHKKKNVGLWLTVGLVVVISVAAFVFAETPAPRPVADASLEPGLLGAADFPTGFYVSNMTQTEMDQLPKPEIPQTVNPTECSELVRDVQPVEKSQSIAAVQASDVERGIAYSQTIVRAGELPSWDPEKSEAMISACREITYTVRAGGTMTLYTSRIDGIEGEGYARSVATGEEFGIGGFVLAVAATKVEGHVVLFMGVGSYTMRGWTFDEVEFVRLANAASDRVRSAL